MWGEEGIRTWGLDDPRLVGLGGIAVPLPVGQTLHHLVAAAHAAAETDIDDVLRQTARFG